MNYKKNQVIISTFMMLTLILLILGLHFYNNYLTRKLTYIQKKQDTFVEVNEIVLDSYEHFSNFIFEAIINDEEITSLFSKTIDADEEELSEIRVKLFNILNETYKISTGYDFRQLHFHLANGNSFLRFHRPEKFGDNLNKIRESVRIANKEKRYVKGFEEGRIFNGYRYVYPLFYENQHIGSVEISVSMASILKQFNKIYPTYDLGFIIKKDVVESKVFSDEFLNYSTSFISNDFVVDNDISQNFENTKCKQKIYENDDFIKLYKEKINDLLKRNESFSIVIEFEGNCYLAHYNIIKNINKKPVAYMFSFNQDKQFNIMKRSLFIELLAIVLSFLIIMTIMFFYDKVRKKMYELALIDPLTKAYNRFSFFDFVSKEISRSERNKSPISFAMLDIDLFKEVNDTYGHTQGDNVIKTIVSIINSSKRESDVLGRYGGEEFVLMFTDSNIDSSLIVAERIRKNIEIHTFPVVGDVTVSIGIAEREEAEVIDDVINRADTALYVAKNSGRNKVNVHNKLSDSSYK